MRAWSVDEYKVTLAATTGMRVKLKGYCIGTLQITQGDQWTQDSAKKRIGTYNPTI